MAQPQQSATPLQLGLAFAAGAAVVGTVCLLSKKHENMDHPSMDHMDHPSKDHQKTKGKKSDDNYGNGDDEAELLTGDQVEKLEEQEWRRGLR
jgi:uncharacterized protein involved in copper resistance